MYEVILLSQPEKFFKKVDQKTARRLAECFANLENDPFCKNTKALSGSHKGRRRCRVGGIRVVYETDQERRKVYIVAILPRGDVYKKGFVM